MARQGPDGLPAPPPDLRPPADLGRRPPLPGASPTTTGTTPRGQLLANGFRHFDFSLAPANLRGIVSDGSVSIVAGVVFAIVGVNQAGAFLVFSFLSFIGIIFFYRAFTLTFSGAGSHRYGYLIFFLPTLLFWTSDVSKEALMIFLLGLTAYGCARILAHRGGGYCAGPRRFGRAARSSDRTRRCWPWAASPSPCSSDPRAPPSNSREPAAPARLIFLGAMVGVAIFVTLHFLPGLNGSISLTHDQSSNNSAAPAPGSGAAASPTPRIPSPSRRTSTSSCSIRCRSTPTAAGSGSRQWRTPCWWGWCSRRSGSCACCPGRRFARPYVIMCVFFTAAFCYSFAALGNLGLITREATVMLPFFLVLLCIPRGPRHRPPRYVWELPRRDRIARRRALARRARAGAPRRAVAHLSAHHRLEGGPPPLGHEVQGELRFAPTAGRRPHRCPAVRVVQELSDRCGHRGNRVVDDHPGAAVAEHGRRPGHGCRHGREAAQVRPR